MISATDIPAIPYGVSDFPTIRRRGMAYVDKTRFIRPLEQSAFTVLLRPRRFGKSLLLSVLENYYDRTVTADFPELFAGTEIGTNPTPEQGQYVVLRFDFSVPPAKPEILEARFLSHCRRRIGWTLRRNRDLFDEDAVAGVLGQPSLADMLEETFLLTRDRGGALCVLVDEYDNFANTVLGDHGRAAYHDFTHGGGFYRHFFTTLKAGTADGSVQRLFLTGVSPVTLDDVTSGFNIAANISLNPRFNEITGFTETEVRDLLARFPVRAAVGADIEETLDTMREWYDGYRFAEEAATTVYNTDMVLYYLREGLGRGALRRNLIDDNVRTDYGRLRHLVVTGRRANGNFDLLRKATGRERVAVRLKTTFPFHALGARENFLSLLHYLGLLSIRGSLDDAAILGIPNETVRRLLYGFLRDAWNDVGELSLDADELGSLLGNMARDGAWRPVVEFLAGHMERQTGIRDYLDGEKTVHHFLMAWLGLGRAYLVRSEVELGKGFADLVLTPDTRRFPSARHGFVIELKYLKRSQKPTEAAINAAVTRARGQLRRYLDDPALADQRADATLTGVALVFHGWQLVRAEAVRPTR